jgi:oligopeptide transport system substrate-binding protein
MNRNSRWFVFVLLALTMLAVVGGVVTAQDEPKVLVSGLVMTSGDLTSIDPTVSEVSSSIEVVNQMFIGLTAQDVTTAETVPGMATGWTVEPTDDGNVAYTFTLMEGVPWVRYNADTGEVEQLMDESGNVRTVTAEDFVYGILRALDPATAAPYAYVPIPYIAGAAEFNNGEAGPEVVQVSAPDSSTVVIVSPEEVAFAPAIYGLWVLRAVPEFAITEFGDSWTEPENIATYGPYAAMEWAHDESFTMVSNPFWPGTEYIPQPAIDQVVLRFLDAEQQLPEYQAGTMDAITLPSADIPRIQADPTYAAEYVTGSNPCTYYYGFNNEELPFSNANLRRAFSQAIDRQSIVENVTRGGQQAAQWFAYPGLNASPTMDLNPDVGVKFDAAAAQESLAAALSELGYASVDELNAIGLTLTYNDTPTHAAIAQAVQQMWAETLGAEVTLSAQESTGYFSRLSEQYPQMARAGWCQDYSDANNFLYDVFYSQSSQNDPGFNNAEFDALVEQARTETDTDVRRDLYAQAENIFSLQEAGIAPIYWYVNNFLIKPYVERAESITGNEAYYLWDINK